MRMTFRGLDSLEKKIGGMANLNAAKVIVKKNGSELHRKMVENAEFHGHYEGTKFVKPTGQTRRSITTEIEDGGLTAKTQPGTEYAPYLEYGTRFMAPQPFVGPAYNVQKEIFKKDLDDLVK